MEDQKKMDVAERNELIKKFFEEHCLQLLDKKGRDYTQGGTDGFKNFRRMKQRFTRLKADEIDMIAVMLYKQMDAIETWVDFRKLQSEPIDQRIADAVNYLLLMYAAIVEKQGKFEPFVGALSGGK